ncbi:MAG: hypothetical protein AABX99_00295 [Nanoarchaeota archaeon]
MKKEIVIYASLFLLFSFLVISMTPSVESYKPGDNSTINVSVSLKQPFVRVEITPNEISLGEITLGYDSNFSNITFINKGTLDASVTPVLDIGANTIFNYLEFATASCATYHNMSYYSVNTTLLGVLSKSNIYNNTGEEDSACVRLGLKDYAGDEIASDMNLSTNLIFWAMPA